MIKVLVEGGGYSLVVQTPKNFFIFMSLASGTVLCEQGLEKESEHYKPSPQ